MVTLLDSVYVAVGVLVAMALSGFVGYLLGYAKGRRDEAAGRPDSWI